MKVFSLFKALWLALGLAVSVAAAAADGPVKVVYHMSEGIPQASRALNNIRNHLSADPGVKIVAVTHGLGIDFLLKDAMNQMEQPFGPAVAEAQVVPSGVAETATLQARQGFVYARP